MSETKTLRPQKILVTGGLGRLGSIVSKSIVDQGYPVRVFDLDNKRNRKTAKALNLEIFWGDITETESVQKALEGIDFVIHMAALIPPIAYENPERTFKVNVGGTKNLVEAIKQSGRNIPFIYTSSGAAFGPSPDATEPLCPDRTVCHPSGPYGETKFEAENIVKSSGIGYLIMRLTATMYLSFEFSDFKRMFTIPLTNRVEYCHPFDTAKAIVNAIKKYEEIKGNTFIIAGGTSQQMLYRDMVTRMLGVYSLPLPPENKFTSEPYYLDWYDTSRSQKLLKYQKRSFEDFIRDFTAETRKKYFPLFLPLMKYFVGPLFGKLIVRAI